MTALFERNVDGLAGILQREAGSTEHHVAMAAIGHTVLNRMRGNGTMRVADIGGYATPIVPSEFAISVARSVLDGTSADVTQGATHFYTPQGMPKETDAPEKLRGSDIGGDWRAFRGL